MYIYIYTSAFIILYQSYPKLACFKSELCQAAYAFVATRTFTLQTDPPVAAMYPMIDLVNGVNMPSEVERKHQDQKRKAEANTTCDMDSMAHMIAHNIAHIMAQYATSQERERERDILRHAWIPGHFSHGDW